MYSNNNYIRLCPKCIHWMDASLNNFSRPQNEGYSPYTHTDCKLVFKIFMAEHYFPVKCGRSAAF